LRIDAEFTLRQSIGSPPILIEPVPTPVNRAATALINIPLKRRKRARDSSSRPSTTPKSITAILCARKTYGDSEKRGILRLPFYPMVPTTDVHESKPTPYTAAFTGGGIVAVPATKQSDLAPQYPLPVNGR
jgi:hypothetical protein